MFVICKKNVNDSDNGGEILYTAGREYEAKIIADGDLLAIDNNGEFGLISISPDERERLGLKMGKSYWGSWFDEHFELIP